MCAGILHIYACACGVHVSRTIMQCGKAFTMKAADANLRQNYKLKMLWLAQNDQMRCSSAHHISFLLAIHRIPDFTILPMIHNGSRLCSSG